MYLLLPGYRVANRTAARDSRCVLRVMLTLGASAGAISTMTSPLNGEFAFDFLPVPYTHDLIQVFMHE